MNKTNNDSYNENVRNHEKICKYLNDLYARKNKDYGNSFSETFAEEGFAMPRIRLTDKLKRFKSLSRGNEQQVTDESICDTLIDLANYAIMTIMEIDGYQEMLKLSQTTEQEKENILPKLETVIPPYTKDPDTEPAGF